MNPIQQAIEALEAFLTGDLSPYAAAQAIEFLRSLQKEGVELPAVTPEDRRFLTDNPDTDGVIAWMQDYARTAIAAALGREATQSDPLEKLTRLQEDMRLYDEATQPTQAEAPSDDWWLDLASRHVNADWNSTQPDGYLNAVKAVVIDALATQPTTDLATIEREHMGDPDKRTGIYATQPPASQGEREAELRRALEIIAVGDAPNPQQQAAEELIALGYWQDIPEARAALATQQAEPEETDPVKLLITDPVRRAAFEAYHNTQSGHYDRMNAAVAAVLAAQQAVQGEPVAAQHRFRHPQKGTPDWSEWQPCKVENRPAWEIDSHGYEVEYRALGVITAPPANGQTVQGEPVTFTKADMNAEYARGRAAGWNAACVENPPRRQHAVQGEPVYQLRVKGLRVVYTVPPAAGQVERTPQDFAMEHAEYMAKDGDRLIDAVNDLARAEQEREDGQANDSDVDAARATVNEAMRALRSGVFEFRKRRDRAARSSEGGDK